MSIVTKENNPELYNALFEEETNEVEIMNKEIKEIFNEIKNEACYTNDELILTFSEGNSLVNYITNLQKENEKLKEIINDDMTVYLKGLEDGKDKMKEIFESVYKSRNEKAVEYIENHTENIDRGTYYEDYVETYDLLNILESGDE